VGWLGVAYAVLWWFLGTGGVMGVVFFWISVVISQAFGIPAFPVDTHIHRLMYRWGFSSGKNVVQTERDAKRLFPKEKWNDLHLQIIWYGREYSPARGWRLENDIITRTIGRKSVINEYHKTRKN
jgi:endonuclease-3